jgi:uncharacterized protein YnzC (UPF0291/DUF896 family)
MNRYLLSIAALGQARYKSLISQAIASLLILSAMNNSACSSVKVADCQKFVQTTTQVNTYFEKHTAQGNALGKRSFKNATEIKQLAKEYIEFFLASVKTSDRAIELIQALAVQDEQLKGYQTEYLSIIKNTKAAINQLSVISAEQSTVTDSTLKDPRFLKLDAAFREKAEALGKFSGEETTLINKVNDYCGQPNPSPSNTPR